MSNRTLPGKWVDNLNGSRSWVLNIGGSTKRFLDSKGGKKAAAEAYDDFYGRGIVTTADGRRRPFVDVAREFIDTKDIADTTRASYIDCLAAVGPRLLPLGTKTRLEHVTEPRIAELRRILQQDYRSARSVNLRLWIVTTTMKYAYRQGYVTSDVTRAVQMVRDRTGRGSVGPKNVPSRQEGMALRDAAPEDWRLLISLGASGLGISEALGVHSEQLHDGELLIDRQYQRIGGRDTFPLPKREKVRTIVLPDWCADDLDWHFEHVAEDGLLFRNRYGGPRRRDLVYNAVWHPTLEGAGFDANRFKFHSLRHWAASTLLAEGAPLTAVAAYLGDTVETVGRTYAHWCRGEEAISASILSRMMRPQLTVVDDPVATSWQV